MLSELAIRGSLHDSYRKKMATFPESTTVIHGDEETDVWCDVAYVDKARKYVDCVIYQSSVSSSPWMTVVDSGNVAIFFL